MFSFLPLIGRLTPREYTALILGFVLVIFETFLRLIILCLPKSVITWFYRRSRTLFLRHTGYSTSTGTTAGAHNKGGPKVAKEEKKTADRILRARDFGELCDLWDYAFEEHVVLTKDGYLLGLHRLPSKRGQKRTHPGRSTGKPVVYLHHGLLMNSEIWVCLTDVERSLPFRLVEEGYDVWLGNNRGNKYSKKSIHHEPNSTKFWDFSIDDFAWHDIPDSIEYILNCTNSPTVGYIGFSQGTAQAFAALSIHPQLNDKVNVFIALAPAMSPAGLSVSFVDGLMKTSPTLIYLFFGRKAILSSAPMWQSILYPPIFTRLIDTALVFLFNWHSHNIPFTQKLASYAHLYSYASTKAVVHWFQIMRNSVFQMYDDELTPQIFRTAVSSYHPVRFPTRNIVTPIVLIYGDQDSLVDIDSMLKELPEKTTEVRRLETYEHLDILWGENVHKDVIPEVLDALHKYVHIPEKYKLPDGRCQENGNGNGVAGICSECGSIVGDPTEKS